MLSQKIKFVAVVGILFHGLFLSGAEDYNPQLASLNATGAAWPDGPPCLALSDIPFLSVGTGGDKKWEVLTWAGDVPGIDYAPTKEYPQVARAKSEGRHLLIRPNTHMPSQFTGGGKFLAMRTSITSTRSISIQVNVKGDDGTALFQDGALLSSGGTYSEKNVGTVRFTANRPTEICIIVANAPGLRDAAIQVPVGKSQDGSGPDPESGDPLGGQPYRIPGITPGEAAPWRYFRTNLGPAHLVGTFSPLPKNPKARRIVVRSKGMSNEPANTILSGPIPGESPFEGVSSQENSPGLGEGKPLP